MLEVKLKKLDEYLCILGLSKDELFAHWLKEKGFSLEDLNALKKQAKSETFVAVQGWRDYPIVNSTFNEDDIRSRIKIGWYAFAGGHFSPDKDAYLNCQGVVGFVNDDPKANVGNRVKVVLRHREYLQWCEKEINTNVTDDDNGRENTRRLLEFGKKAGVKFPAMEFAQNYAFDGVKPGEAYVPARDELKELSKNSYIINEVLRKIDGSFDDWQWSSSEYGNYTVWHVYSGNGIVSNYHKNLSGAVSCLLAY